MQDDYMDRIMRRRVGEAELFWDALESAGVTAGDAWLLDFRFFSTEREGADALVGDLGENYDVSCLRDESQGVWFVKGTTRPAAIELDSSILRQWVEFMVEAGLARGCVFSGWVATDPAGRTLDSEEIEFEED